MGRYRYQFNTIQYNTIQYNTIQYNTIQYNTTQHNTIQYNTIQYNIIQGLRVYRLMRHFFNRDLNSRLPPTYKFGTIRYVLELVSYTQKLSPDVMWGKQCALEYHRVRGP